ncbi:helix-turn-helix domain-containing protein [Sphingobacterium sp.]|uniref:helix-turn-helix domain-containing protein n=1 Tax=Sphingobacterium sp. TaxID=341027 RepID=UPI002899B0C7|nr:helix-turn-helix domain-containing protein [Sphingobacterium sp.]
MVGKPKRMSQINQLIRLYQSGSGIKTIARILGMSKNRMIWSSVNSCFWYFWYKASSISPSSRFGMS